MTSKLVFVGDMGVGKTTAIAAISDFPPVSTEMPISDLAEGVHTGKTHTTVALDYSSIELGDGELLHVYGVPGQAYLDFMWPIVAEGALAVVVLVNAQDPRALENSIGLLQRFSALAPQACFAVGLTCHDRNPDFSFQDLRAGLTAAGYRLPLMRVDARQAVQVELLIRALLSYRYAQSLA